MKLVIEKQMYCLWRKVKGKDNSEDAEDFDMSVFMGTQVYWVSFLV